MALKGAYNYRGIAISEAYVKINNVSYGCNSNQVTTEKTAAVYNSDGTLKTEAVMETKWVETTNGSYSASVYKDKAARDADPNNSITSIGGGVTMSVAASGKNPLNQAYLALKAEDAYTAYTDV
tara:strand:- start:409 stop:780 length:372 start_codon:yes stop_codon:yes gene_type:complete